MTHKKPVEGREKNLLNKIHLSQQVKWSICFPMIVYPYSVVENRKDISISLST